MKLSKIPEVCCIPECLELPDRVYKYRKIDEFLFRSLILNQIWFAKPDSFNDPFEPERIFSGTQFSRALARNIHEAGMLCLCKSNSNLPMWSYYGEGLRGVAIGYDLPLLLESLMPVEPSTSECSPRYKYVYDLDYRDEDLREINEEALLRNDSQKHAELQKMFATKSQAFQHEEECRIVVEPSPDTEGEYAWHGHGLYRHAPDAVKEIVFGELVSKQDRQAIMQIMEGRKVEFWQAEREEKRFKIKITRASESEAPASESLNFCSTNEVPS